MENLSWPKVHQIWKRKSGKQGRKYLAKCQTRWKMIQSKIIDLKKEVFACETVAFIKKYLAIAAYFLNPTSHKSQFLLNQDIFFVNGMIDLRVFFDKSQFLWRLDSVQSKEKNLEMNPGWTTSEFYRNFQSKSQYYWTRYSKIDNQVIVKMVVSYVPKCFTNFHFNFFLKLYLVPMVQFLHSVFHSNSQEL